jgi:hypothetical protein
MYLFFGIFGIWGDIGSLVIGGVDRCNLVGIGWG